MRLDRLVIASKNPDKVAEMTSLVREAGIAAEVADGLSWPDVPETAATLVGNALLKARAVADATGLPTLADDTGLEVPALGGAPGVMSARFAGPRATYADNVGKLLTLMAGKEDRRAIFRTVVALTRPAGRAWTAEGVLEGSIALVPRGRKGFGYDPVFEVDGRTLAEMSADEKNRLSHRARAIERLAAAMAG